MSEEPLHEIVLRVVYLANPERPLTLSTDDVFWKVEQPHMSPVKLKEVLEWLVRKGDMEKDLGKYILSRPKFFELKKEYGPAPTPSVVEPKLVPKQKRKTRPTPQPKTMPAPVAQPAPVGPPVKVPTAKPKPAPAPPEPVVVSVPEAAPQPQSASEPLPKPTNPLPLILLGIQVVLLIGIAAAQVFKAQVFSQWGVLCLLALQIVWGALLYKWFQTSNKESV